jgi:hypothetical protein
MGDQPTQDEDQAMTTKHGKCRDCAQGILTKVHEGFELFVLDGQPCHWFCVYCGSNHVEIQCPTCNGGGQDAAHAWPDGTPAACEVCEGTGTITQGDNYPDSPLPYVPPCEVCGGILSHKDNCKFNGRRVTVE